MGSLSNRISVLIRKSSRDFSPFHTQDRARQPPVSQEESLPRSHGLVPDPGRSASSTLREYIAVLESSLWYCYGCLSRLGLRANARGH